MSESTLPPHPYIKAWDERIVALSRALDAKSALLAEAEKALETADFVFEEITDREGREGLTDYDFAEQVIALVQSRRGLISAVLAKLKAASGEGK